MLLSMLLGKRIFWNGSAPGGDPATPPANPGGQEPPNPPAPGGTSPGPEPGAGKSGDDKDKIIADLRKEAADNRVKARDAEAKLKAIDDAALSETDRLKKHADESSAKATAASERVLKSEIKLAAKDANIVDPDAAYALLDKSKIKLDGDGEPTNLKELMEALVTEKPYLVGQAPAVNSGSPGNPARSGGRAISLEAQIEAEWNSRGRGKNPGRL